MGMVGSEPSAVSFLLDEISDGVPHGPLEPQIHRSRHLLVEASEEFAHEQLRRDLVDLFLTTAIIPAARVPDRCGDVRHPVEPSHAFKGLAVFGVGCPGNDLLQFLVEEFVVFLRVEGEVSLVKGTKSQLRQPLPERLHTVCMADRNDVHFLKTGNFPTGNLEDGSIRRGIPGGIAAFFQGGNSLQRSTLGRFARVNPRIQ